MTDGSLAAVPTPDEGIRLSQERLWDEDTRPRGPAADPARRYTRLQQLAGQRLIDVHDYLRAELDQLRMLMAGVAAGTTDPASARSSLHTMTIRQAHWQLGGYCEAFCRVVSIHHAREDTDVFPQLRRFEPRLGPVIDRLEDEHLAIHAVVDRLDRILISQPLDIEVLQAAVDLLTDTLLSHLSYEERELTEPLARMWGL
jgi:hypothetical protein